MVVVVVVVLFCFVFQEIGLLLFVGRRGSRYIFLQVSSKRMLELELIYCKNI